MSLDLIVDVERWQAHLSSVAATSPGLVPVTKGNGYGFGLARTAAAAQAIRADTLAIGLAHEVAVVRESFTGDLLVLQPWEPAIEALPTADPHVIRTVADLDAAAALAAAGVRYLIEARSSMRRFGVEPATLAAGGADLLAGSAGVALHLPLAATGSEHAAEVERLLAVLDATRHEIATLWVSHLDPAEATELRTAHPQLQLRERIGTRLWLGDRAAATVRSQVLAVHPLSRGDRFGYRQRRAARAGVLLIVAGGTAHGIGLTAPSAAGGLADRGKTAARGLLESGGRALSPFRLEGRRLWFAEPPHMQVSMLLADADAPVAVGQSLSVDVRMTTVAVDQVIER